jgi:hypothetical protein
MWKNPFLFAAFCYGWRQTEGTDERRSTAAPQPLVEGSFGFGTLRRTVATSVP